MEMVEDSREKVKHREFRNPNWNDKTTRLNNVRVTELKNTQTNSRYIPL